MSGVTGAEAEMEEVWVSLKKVHIYSKLLILNVIDPLDNNLDNQL